MTERQPTSGGSVHGRALDLAERLDLMADEVGGWATCSTRLRQAASSLRWQVRWEERHPMTAYYSDDAIAARTGRS